MSRLLLLLLSLFLTAGAQERPRLILTQKIGTDWQPEDRRWMNFVAISSDGSKVAANGNAAGALGLWTFPAGEFLRSIAGEPLAISADFRYLATETSVLDIESGKTMLPIPQESHAGAFSPSGDYIALISTSPSKGKPTRIGVWKTADGSAVANFGTRYTAVVAFHPDNRTLASGHWNNVSMGCANRNPSGAPHEPSAA